MTSKKMFVPHDESVVAFEILLSEVRFTIRYRGHLMKNAYLQMGDK
jgi:hypothetical protein